MVSYRAEWWRSSVWIQTFLCGVCPPCVHVGSLWIRGFLSPSKDMLNGINSVPKRNPCRYIVVRLLTFISLIKHWFFSCFKQHFVHWAIQLVFIYHWFNGSLRFTIPTWWTQPDRHTLSREEVRVVLTNISADYATCPAAENWREWELKLLVELVFLFQRLL